MTPLSSSARTRVQHAEADSPTRRARSVFDNRPLRDSSVRMRRSMSSRLIIWIFPLGSYKWLQNYLRWNLKMTEEYFTAAAVRAMVSKAHSVLARLLWRG